jgi:activating signal cointegrator 1
MNLMTITQPWASLIAVGAKRIETRDWRTWYRGELAIHAAKGLDGIFKGAKTEHLVEQCAAPPFAEVLAEHGLTAGSLPRGAVVAIATLARCTEMQPASIDKLARTNPREHAFGWYRTGRFAWVLEDVRLLRAPYQLRGQQYLWPVPDADAQEIRRLAEPATRNMTAEYDGSVA